MDMIQLLTQEMSREAETTRKMLSVIPNDQYDWRPHEKSMTVRALATHIAELPTWVTMVFETAELDFATTPYKQVVINDTESLLKYFEDCLQKGTTSISAATQNDLLPQWTLRNAQDIYWQGTKYEMIRSTYCQIVHHRAQMGVYMRLLNVPIPGSYGPSADDMSF